MCTLFDAHAHFHDAFCVSAFLNHAALNFQTAADRLATDDGKAPACALAICETDAQQPPLRRIRDAIESSSIVDWNVLREDDSSLVVHRDPRDDRDIHQLILVASRQLVTSERLEVLSLCSPETIQDNQPLRAMVDQIANTEAIPVIPWGFGKWLFSRSRSLSDYLNAHAGDSSKLFLGDNGCRWRGWRPTHLGTAQRLGIHCLAGSDPLPIKEHEVRAAAFGSILNVRIGITDPATELREAIARNANDARTFGDCRSLPTRRSSRPWSRP